MAVRLRLCAAAPRGRATAGSASRAGTTGSRRPSAAPAPCVLDRVSDQHGGAWIRYGTTTRALWIPVSDFTRQEIFTRLARIDPRLIEAGAQHRLRSEIARSNTYRPAVVAAAPGWTANHFVLGDGAALAPYAPGQAPPREVIVTFDPGPKFTARGTLAEWQAALGPFVAEQPYLLFGLALAFVGPLLPFVPPDYLSPLFEFTGGSGSGKSLAGMVAMSAWAGDPDNLIAGGETWDRTPGTFDAVKLAHRHGLLLLDEATMAGNSLDARRKVIQPAIFSLTSSGARQRFGAPSTGLHAQLAVISTSNRSLSDLIEGSPAEREALHQRMITIPVASTRAHGIFNFVPAGHESSAGAAEALRAQVNEQWGTAGPDFVRCIQKNVGADEDRFRAILGRGLAHNRELMSDMTNLARVQKCFALVAVAGLLARRWGILPKRWGSPVAAVQAVMREAFAGSGTPSDPRATINSYVERHRAHLIRVSDLNRPLTNAEFGASVGFLQQRRGGVEVLIPAALFQATFSSHKILMRALRNDGHARTEGGRKPKLTIKTPRAICSEGRVYCIFIDR